MISRCQLQQLDEGLKEHLKKHHRKYIIGGTLATGLGLHADASEHINKAAEAHKEGIIHRDEAESQFKQADEHADKQSKFIKSANKAAHKYSLARTNSEREKHVKDYNYNNEMAKQHSDLGKKALVKSASSHAKMQEKNKEIQYHTQKADTRAKQIRAVGITGGAALLASKAFKKDVKGRK